MVFRSGKIIKTSLLVNVVLFNFVVLRRSPVRSVGRPEEETSLPSLYRQNALMERQLSQRSKSLFIWVFLHIRMHASQLTR